MNALKAGLLIPLGILGVVFLTFAVPMCGESAAGDAHRLYVKIRHYGLGPGSWHIYSSMGTSPNGDIYAGICNYSYAQGLTEELNGAHLVRYSPQEDRVYDLGDMQDVTGQRTQTTAYAQSKIHTPILFDADGTAWFGTHSVERDYLPGGKQKLYPDKYPGGHWICYEPAKNRFTDFGIATPGESIMGMAYDPVRRKIFGTTHEKSLLVEYDIKTQTSLVRATVGKYPTRMMAYLADGSIYTFDERGWVIRYNPDKQTIERTGLRIPNGGCEADLISVFSLCTDSSRTHLYGISTLIDEVTVKNLIKGGYLFELSLSDDGNLNLADLGSASVAGGTVISEAGLFHAMTMGMDGKVYWTAPQKDAPVHLISYDPRTGQRRDYGEMWAEDNSAYAYAIFAAATGLDGSLYWSGLLKSDSDNRWNNEAVLLIAKPQP